MDFPNIDPVLIEIGPFAIRWYALAYIVGLIGGWWLLRRLVAQPPYAMKAEQVDDLLVWATLGTVLGGRLGYVLFYNLPAYMDDPLRALMVWEGGMAFHGGLIGVILAVILFCRRHKLPLWQVADAVACVSAIGLLFGRIANFINGELFGRVAPPDLPWAMVFPRGGPDPRHPSQLYEAALEGLLLLVLMLLLWRFTKLRFQPGQLAGIFLVGYALARITAEFYREPDAHIGFLAMGVTMGQLLSLPMLAVGVAFIWRARRGPVLEVTAPPKAGKAKKAGAKAS
ncbi:MAG: prolipoprotein diacylglyceryl transferase [Rhodospirillaceae bacterium]